MDTYQQFIHQSRYARWNESMGMRESWQDTIFRYLSFMEEHMNDKFDVDISPLRQRLFNSIKAMEVMPSMRCMMTAGKALERENIAGYNCSYLPVDHPRAFDEALYILMNGTGVGFSVERDNVDKLPTVPDTLVATEETFLVPDSKKGWAEALRFLIASLYKGEIPKWDTSNVRPAGAKLKTFGGRASGPIPLQNLYHFVVNKFKAAQGRKLTDLECHDIMCKIGEIVVVGGVRRSAMISLSNLGSLRMRDAKAGKWWEDNQQRALANNSWVATGDVDASTFMEEWLSLMKSGSGERGIFNRAASVSVSEKYGRDTNHEFGTNPCSEIILRPYQFCNLTEVVARADDTYASLEEKVEMATILGTIQSTLTDFKHLRKIWKDNTEDERLLGVSITGIYDCPLLTHQNAGLDATLDRLRQHALSVNRTWAGYLGIKPSAAITCVKPSGTVSQLVDASSGIHPRHSKYYIRTVRGDIKDPLTQFLMAKGVPHEPEFNNPDSTVVFSFPQVAPAGTMTRADVDPIEHLELWKTYQQHWCMHKPSITVSVRDKDWVRVGAWVYENFDICAGLSFLPYSEHTYAQAPYQECTQYEWEQLIGVMPGLDWLELAEFEAGEDHTKSSQTMACSADGGGCEIVDI